MTAHYAECILQTCPLCAQAEARTFRQFSRRRSWLPLTNYTSTDLSVEILDQAAAGGSHKFYREV